MPEYVKISELENGTKIGKGDYIVYEGDSSGTKRIKYEDFMESIIPSGAASHNGIYRGADLTSRGVDAICAKIADGTFDDLFIGDFFDVEIATPDATPEAKEKVRCVLAGFDTYLHNGDTELTKHHAVIVPKNCFKTRQKMNNTDVTTGGYVGSEMYKTVLPKYVSALEAEGVLKGHLLQYRDLLTTTVSTTGASMAGAGWQGYSSGWGWQDVKMRLLSEVQVYGTTVFSSSFYDVGAANLQLPIFRFDPSFKIAGLGGTGEGRTWWWLSAVASSTFFAAVASAGASHNSSASSLSGCRPLFLIGNAT